VLACDVKGQHPIRLFLINCPFLKSSSSVIHQWNKLEQQHQQNSDDDGKLCIVDDDKSRRCLLIVITSRNWHKAATINRFKVLALYDSYN